MPRGLADHHVEALVSGFAKLRLRGPKGDVRAFFKAVEWLVRSGLPWRDLPAGIGRWDRVYRRFRRWALSGRWEELRLKLRAPAAHRVLLMIDSTIVKAHPHAAGARRSSGGQRAQALGRSRGGFTTKLHAAMTERGELVRYHLTGGESADITQAHRLVRARDGIAVVADRAYDSDAFIAYVRALRMRAVVPARANRRRPRRVDPDAYATRNVIERWFGRIKSFRRVATRYEKTSSSYIGFVAFVATLVALTRWPC